MARRGDLEAERRSAFAAQLAGRFRPRVPELTGSDASALLQLHERERQARARGVAARSDTGARREQHAIVAEGAERWATFAGLLADARRRGLRHLREEEVSELVARYRELTADLARLRTAARGRDVDALFYLSRLVAGGHNLFYRQQPIPLTSLVHYLGVTVPREVRRAWRPILLAAAMMFLPMIWTWYRLVEDPSLVPRFVPPSMIDRAESARERERRGEGYLPQEIAGARGPLLESAISTNNLQVTYVAFAGGIAAGLGTAFLLVTNGVSIGAGFAVFQNAGALDSILGFVAAHGVLELTAICLAGAGGLLLGAAILIPGARTRRDALIENGRHAIHLVACSTFFLVIAGAIEGNISPSSWPNERKYVISLATAVLMGLYLWLGGRERREPLRAGDRSVERGA